MPEPRIPKTVRGLLGPPARRTLSLARRLDAHSAGVRARRLFARSRPRPAALLCVYRRRNRGQVQLLVEQARALDMSVALWALDAPIPELDGATVGVGPGLRMDLLNRLWREVAGPALHQVVVADDDVTFTHGSLGLLLAAADACGFGLAQPAHHWESHCSHEITRKRVLTLARATTFVEVGPLFVVTGRWISRVLPFPDGFGMGWGLSLAWLDLFRQGCRLGIVDCTTVFHPAPEEGREYDTDPERDRLLALLRERNLESPGDAQRTLGRWRSWEARPPWSPHEKGGRSR